MPEDINVSCKRTRKEKLKKILEQVELLDALEENLIPEQFDEGQIAQELLKIRSKIKKRESQEVDVKRK